MKIEKNIKNKKSLGQNFLIDKNIIKKIINRIQIKDKKILEIGPGNGSLTDEIIKKKPKSLLLIEKDNELFHYLKKKYEKYKFINILNKDILKYKFENIKNYKIISNLPYNISRKILLNTFILYNNFDEIIFMIQKELAEKFDISKSKMNKYNFYSNLCGEYKIMFNVSPNVFYPKPKVISSVIKFKNKKKEINRNKLDYFLKYFFKNKRKKIKSNKEFLEYIDKNILDYRYEDLNYVQILKIYQRFKFTIS